VKRGGVGPKEGSPWGQKKSFRETLHIIGKEGKGTRGGARRKVTGQSIWKKKRGEESHFLRGFAGKERESGPLGRVASEVMISQRKKDYSTYHLGGGGGKGRLREEEIPKEGKNAQGNGARCWKILEREERTFHYFRGGKT